MKLVLLHMLTFIELKTVKSSHLEMELYIEGKELFIVEWGMKYFDFLCSYIPESWSIYIAKFQQNPLKEVEDQLRTLTLNPDFVIKPKKEVKFFRGNSSLVS